MNRTETTTKEQRDADGISRVAALLLAALLAAGPALAGGGNENNADTRTRVTGGAYVLLTAADATTPDATTKVTPTAALEVDGPLRFTSDAEALVRLRGLLEIVSQPDTTVNLADASTYGAAHARLTLEHYLGNVRVVGGWGFSTRAFGGDPAPLRRTLREWGAGLAVGNGNDEPTVEALYGRDEVCGDFGLGQLMVRGQVPITGTDGAIIVAAKASVSFGRDRQNADGTPVQQRDVVWLGTVVDVGATIKALKK